MTATWYGFDFAGNCAPTAVTYRSEITGIWFDESRRIEEFHRAASAPPSGIKRMRWFDCFRSGAPVVLPNAQQLRDDIAPRRRCSASSAAVLAREKRRAFVQGLR